MPKRRSFAPSCTGATVPQARVTAATGTSSLLVDWPLQMAAVFSCKTIVLGSIRDDGMVYGAVQEGSAASDAEAVVAQLDLSTGTGEPKVLGAGIDIPHYTSVNGSGLFVTRDEDKNVRISLRRER